MATRKGGYSCICRGCASRTGQGISLFSLPNDPGRLVMWLKACNREDLLGKDLCGLHKNYRLCEYHFEEQYIAQGIRKTLFEGAIPTIFPHTLRRQTSAGMSDESSNKVIVLSDMTITPRAVESIHRKVETIVSPESASVTAGVTIVPPSKDSTQVVVRSSFPCASAIAGPSGIHTTTSPITSPSTSTQTPASLSAGTPRKKKLKRKLKALRQRRLIGGIGKQESDLQNFYRLCDKYLGEPLASLIKPQALLKERRPLGRRYSMEFKQFALTLYFLGPRAYKFMGKLFCLPTKRSLQRLTQQLACKPGLDNESVFQALAIKIRTMRDEDKYCSLCIDEMALKANLYFHTQRDEIVGLVDTGDSPKEFVAAQNVLVIMARGLYTNWKQPISYFFVGTQLKVAQLRPIIEKCVMKLESLGLHVECLVSDMGSNFIDLANTLGVTQNSVEFDINGKKIVYLFDPCHLIKATRNNLINNVFCFDNKKTSWSFIESFYNQDRQKFYRMASKLTNSHIYPSNFDKMKVRFATQVLSNTVASGMNTYMSLGALSGEAIGTIEVVEKFNKLFDIFNSIQLQNHNKYKNAFVAADYQNNFLNEMIKFLENLRILNKKGEDVTSRSRTRKCWLITINGLKKLWPKLSSVNFRYLLTRRLNTDCLENFFGSVRQQGGNSINPTPIQFERIFRKLFCQNYLHTNEMNCKEDLDELLLNLHSTINIVDENVNIKQNIAIVLPDYDYRKEKLTTLNAFNYVCGYLMKKALYLHRCETCINYSKQCEDLNITQLLTHFKAYDTDKSIYGGLRVPSEHFINYIYKLETTFSSMFEEVCIEEGMSHKCLEKLQNIEFVHPCPDFPALYVLKLFIRLKIFYCIKYINRDIVTKKYRNRKLRILSHL